MARLKTLATIMLISLLIAMGCVEPYAPPVTEGNSNFLVVDGYLNVTDSSATIRLTRSVPLHSIDPPPGEENATVTIDDGNGQTIFLNADGNGRYRALNVSFDFNKQYVVNIKTSDSYEFQSSPIPLKRTPEIDSLNWTIDGNTLKVNVNTHDDTGQSRYYRWEFEETYEYTSPFNSHFVLTSTGGYRAREDDEYIEHCWKTSQNQNIKLGSSVRLSEDIISNHAIRTIEGGSILLSWGYQINVTQQTLTEAGHRYWTNVQKTSESLGGLFDPLPSEVSGNIYPTNNDSHVIGYISGGELKTARLFIDFRDVKDLLPRFKHTYPCQVDTVSLGAISSLSYKDALLNAVYSKGTFPVIVGFTASTPMCNDCRVFGGGTTTKPEDWKK